MNMQDALDLPFEKFLLISWRKNISAYSKNFHIPKFLVVEEIKLFYYVHKILLLLIFYLKIPTLDTSSLKKEIKTLRNIHAPKKCKIFISTTKYSTCPYFHSQNSESKKESKPQKTHTKFFSHLHSVSQNFHSQNHQRKTRSSDKK